MTKNGAKRTEGGVRRPDFASGRVVAAELQLHAEFLILVEEIIALEQLVGEFGEAEPVTCLAVEPLLHAVLGHHVVDGDVLADEVEEGKVLHPVIVVDHLGLVRIAAVEVKELAYLLLDYLLVMVKGLRIEEVALLAFA